MKLVRVVFAKAFVFPGATNGLPIKSAAGADYTMSVEDGVVMVRHAKSPTVIGVPVSQCELLVYEPTQQPLKKAS